MFVEEKRFGEFQHPIALGIERAASLMRPDAWFSPGNGPGNGPCPEQALPADAHYELAIIAEAADLIFPSPWGHWLSPQRFNDFPGRTFEDVRLVMDVAAEMVRRA